MNTQIQETATDISNHAILKPEVVNNLVGMLASSARNVEQLNIFTRQVFDAAGQLKLLEVNTEGGEEEQITPPPTKVNWKGPSFNLIPLHKQGHPTVRIINPEIRNFMVVEMNSEVVEYHNLIEHDDSARTIANKTHHSTYSLEQIYKELETSGYFDESKEAELFKEDQFTEYPVKAETFQEFCKAIKETYFSVRNMAQNAFQAGSVSFEELAAVMNTQGLILGMNHRGVIGGVETVRAEVKQSMMGTYIQAVIKHWDCANGRIGETTRVVYYSEFEGKQTTSSLGLYLVSQDDKLKEALITRGKRYLELVQAPAYVHNTGTMDIPDHLGRPMHQRATGRVMIDRAGLVDFRPNFSMFYGDSTNLNERNSLLVTHKIIPERALLLMPPVVYGFSFAQGAKNWGEFKVDHLSPIKFRDKAFDQLQLPEGRKDLLLAKVLNVGSNDSETSDIIDGKGGGFIGLLAGNPGVGKTLTAETIAEKLYKPLYIVNVGELGTNPESLEASLNVILQTATSWDAVLLIDEADVFLEERTTTDIERNAMVAVFLRMLEYYQGIMFLTTNRAQRIDAAFRSRINMSLYYANLTVAARKNIWDVMLELRNITGINTIDLAQVALNGRQIKNTCNGAQALANYYKVPVNQTHIQMELDLISEFDSVLEQHLVDGISKA
jgi:hypothetical protein